jgi:hypothetical protein
MMASLIIAGILLFTGDAGESIRKFFRKLAGDRGMNLSMLQGKQLGMW